MSTQRGNEMKVTSYFQKQIVENGMIPQGIDPRHVEGYIRLEHSILGELSWATIKREVKLCISCIREGGIDAAERNAQSFGL